MPTSIVKATYLALPPQSPCAGDAADEQRGAGLPLAVGGSWSRFDADGLGAWAWTHTHDFRSGCIILSSLPSHSHVRKPLLLVHR